MTGYGTGPAMPSPAGFRTRWQRHLRSLARDFFLIVTGVLTALALENWNSGRKDRQLEVEYLRALSADVRAHVARCDQWLEVLAVRKDWTATIWGWANGADPEQPVDQVLLWIRLGGQQSLNTHFEDGAFEDLISSGRLSLIQNRELREAIINYYEALPFWAGAIEANGSRAAESYRTAVAGVIPAALAWPAAMHEDMTSVDLTEVLAEFRRRPAVRQELVGMAQSHDFRTSLAQDGRGRALVLLEELERESGRLAHQGG